MKYVFLLALPLLVSSCTLLQIPARAVNTVLGPITSGETEESADQASGVALKVARPAARHSFHVP